MIYSFLIYFTVDTKFWNVTLKNYLFNIAKLTPEKLNMTWSVNRRPINLRWRTWRNSAYPGTRNRTGCIKDLKKHGNKKNGIQFCFNFRPLFLKMTKTRKIWTKLFVSANFECHRTKFWKFLNEMKVKCWWRESTWIKSFFIYRIIHRGCD